MRRDREQVPQLKVQKNTDAASGHVVLVGTYKGDQLAKWRGWYNWPLTEADFSAAKNAKDVSHGDTEAQRGGARSQASFDWLSRITELWLFKDTAGQKDFKAKVAQ